MHQKRYCIVNLFGRWGTFRTKKGANAGRSHCIILHTHKLNKHETQITVLISGLHYKESEMLKKTKQNQLDT
jgi:hypothetical protein